MSSRNPPPPGPPASNDPCRSSRRPVTVIGVSPFLVKKLSDHQNVFCVNLPRSSGRSCQTSPSGRAWSTAPRFRTTPTDRDPAVAVDRASEEQTLAGVGSSAHRQPGNRPPPSPSQLSVSSDRAPAARSPLDWPRKRWRAGQRPRECEAIRPRTLPFVRPPLYTAGPRVVPTPRPSERADRLVHRAGQDD
jgi:hypothetical protein